jgi:hyperosmotically inducible periplasmic protein
MWTGGEKEMKPVANKIRWAFVALMIAAPAMVTASATPRTLDQEVRHQLLMLPYYDVFDNLEFQVSGGTVTLLGQVTSAVLKSDAAAAVKRIPGVTAVTNDIEVLPLTPMDNRIRLAELRAIYRNSVLNRYAAGPLPSIRIIVKNGHVTLAGVVASQMDRNVAGVQANGVPFVFAVTNNLIVSKS